MIGEVKGGLVYPVDLYEVNSQKIKSLPKEAIAAYS